MIPPTLYSGNSFAGQRIGLLGGSFNPAHQGHVAISRAALQRLDLHQVWWLVSPQNPLKPLKGMGRFEDRLLEATRLAKANPKIQVTGIERELGTRYTVDTILMLQRRMPLARFVWLMGMDNLLQIDRWHRWDELFEAVPIAVFQRPGYSLAQTRGPAVQRFAAFRLPLKEARSLALATPPAWIVLDNKLDPHSATQIRQRQGSHAFIKPHHSSRD